MKLLILYQPNTEHARTVEEYVHDFNRRYPDSSVVLTDVDSVEGIEEAELYDVVEYPTLLALAQDGSLLSSWSGVPLPLMDAVAGYLR